MCLNKIDRSIKIGKDKIGYKLMTGGNFYDDPVQEVCYYTGYAQGSSQRCKVGEWVGDKADNVISCGEDIRKPFRYYRTGFHIFTSAESARYFRDRYSWYGAKIVKVNFSKVVARGYQYVRDKNLRCLVVRKIKVIGEVE